MRVTVDHHEMPARDFNNNRRISTTTAQCQRTALRCLALGLAGAAVGDNAQSIAGYNPSGGVCRCRIKKLVVQVVKRCDACPISTGKPRKGVRSPNRVQSAYAKQSEHEQLAKEVTVLDDDAAREMTWNPLSHQRLGIPASFQPEPSQTAQIPEEVGLDKKCGRTPM